MLTERDIRHIIWELKKGRDTKVVTKEMKVSQRRIQQLWAEYKKTGKFPIRGCIGHPKKTDLSDVDVEMVLDVHRRWPDGVQMTVRRLRRSGSDIIHNKVCQILKSNGLVAACPANQKCASGRNMSDFTPMRCGALIGTP